MKEAALMWQIALFDDRQNAEMPITNDTDEFIVRFFQSLQNIVISCFILCVVYPVIHHSNTSVIGD